MRRSLLAAGVLAMATLAACTSSNGGAASESPTTEPPATTTSSAELSSGNEFTQAPPPQTSSTTTTPSADPTTGAAPSSTPRPSPTSLPPAFATTCTRLITRVLPGGAARGAEIAGIQYENAGTTTCTITGTPTAQLLNGGREVGPQSRPTVLTARPFTLKPGDVAEALLRDFSTCNAPLSDHVRVSVPRRGGAPTTTVAVATLRACTLRVAPVGAPS